MGFRYQIPFDARTPGATHREDAVMTTAGIILAAGQSERFGKTNKLLADFRGEPLASHAACVMANAGFEHLIAVNSDFEVEALFEGFSIEHVQTGCDQSASLRAGMNRAINLNATRVVIALADMPLVDTKTLKAVDRLCMIHGVSACTDRIKISPPAGFSTTHFEELRAISGDSGARALLQSLPSERLLNCSAELLLDVDTIDELLS